MAFFECMKSDDGNDYEVVETVLKTTATIPCEIDDIIFAWSVFSQMDNFTPIGAIKLGGGLGPAAGGADSRGYAYIATDTTANISNGGSYGYMLLRKGGK